MSTQIDEAGLGRSALASGSRRALVFCLEAFDPDLTDTWCAEGLLPTFAALRERGVWGRMRSNTDLSSGATWSSVFTGTNPGKHGTFFFPRQLRSGSYHVGKLYADQVGGTPFWKTLAGDGKRVAVVDDVLTTGATAAELARTLRAAGATSVVVWVCAGRIAAVDQASRLATERALVSMNSRRGST